MSVPATFLILDDWLEYLIVTPQGKSHESLFQTEVRPSLLNAAILALGLEPGERMQWVDRDPPPTEEEMEAGVRPIVPVAPKGPELFLYAEWTSGDEVYRYRVPIRPELQRIKQAGISLSSRLEIPENP